MRKLLLPALVLALLGVGLLTALPRSVVDWRALRAVAFESDDWGLAGFVPHADAWTGLERDSLEPGRFPAVYWGSTLEDADLVRRMTDLLLAHRGRDGLPAVFQPNYVMASLAWDGPGERWKMHTLPEWPDAYGRPGLWPAVEKSLAAGVWHPEYHAYLHYDPERRREAALSTPVAREATRRGITLFPGSEEARELGPARDPQVVARELDAGLEVFARVFGRGPGAIIAPDYTWVGAAEKLWVSRGVRVIQAKREQRHPGYLAGPAGRVQKVLDRQWSRAVHQDRIYLERNCRLEPVQAPDPAAITRACVDQAQRAWERGEPAIVETHRVNFAHTDPAVRETGLGALDAVLGDLAGAEPGPLFLCDTEIAQLARRGVSWRRAGDRLILRNGTRSSRIVGVPGLAGMPPGLYRIAAGRTVVLDGAAEDVAGRF